MNDNEASPVKAMEGQIAGLTLALIRIAKASADPAAVASELEIASRMADDGPARSQGATFMLRLIANAIRQEGNEAGSRG